MTSAVSTGAGERRGGVAHEVAEVVGTRRVGAYQHLTLVAPGVADLARPGQFVALAVGDESSATLLRRSFSIHRVTPSNSDGATEDGTDSGKDSGTVEIVVSAVGAGTRWITARQPHDTIDVIGPLGQAFPLPADPVACVLVGGGYGSAPLFWLADELRQRGCHVELVLGAASEDRLFGVDEGRRSGDGLTVTTDDGSAGHRGWVSDVLPGIIERTSAGIVFGCGPMAMLESITDIAQAHGAVAQVAVEESMACGVGVCMTCVMPVVGSDGRTRMVRSCVEGPVFRGDAVRWDAFEGAHCRVPDDAVGAPKAGGH